MIVKMISIGKKATKKCKASFKKKAKIMQRKKREIIAKGETISKKAEDVKGKFENEI